LSVGVASPPRSLDFSIAASPGTYVSGKPIALRCKLTNVTSSRQTVLLPGRHSGAPGFLRARLWSDRGALLTKNDASPEGWWSVRVLDSTLYREAEGDRAEIAAGRDLRFEVDLAVILRGCRALGARPLRPGRYRVQLDSEVGPSNELTIEVTAASARSSPRSESSGTGTAKPGDAATK
jgi:hypothetical protein